ncbi:MAG: hypothetical protein ACFB3T_12230 [Geminicoccaceae bacterium]
MRDAILAVLGLAGFVIFVGILIWKVQEPDLIVVVVLGIAAAAFDFARELWRQRSR